MPWYLPLCVNNAILLESVEENKYIVMTMEVFYEWADKLDINWWIYEEYRQTENASVVSWLFAKLCKVSNISKLSL